MRSRSLSFFQLFQRPVVLAAGFIYSPGSPVLGRPVTFSDTSTGGPTSWEWDFGDGAASTLQNPSHTYAAAGAHSITLTVRSGSNSRVAKNRFNSAVETR